MDRSLSTVCILYNKGVKYAPYEAKWLEKTHLHDIPLDNAARKRGTNHLEKYLFYNSLII